ncbi:MAG: patatin-like phospholipase family protein [Pygmaiobacter massiliensis]|nr:patatin-like phospholipase family protein [Pygmaiobacter massiliensis]
MAVKGLVLAGGGARGAYQIGVKQALDELGFRPAVYTGTSVGCLNGAMFALDMDHLARSLWCSISDKDVMVLPEKFWGRQLVSFAKQVAEAGGLDVSPLEKTVRMLVDEEKLRSLPVRYGLVTVNKSTLQPVCVSLEEIPSGQLADYMMASAACFPAIRPHDLDGEAYIDGGYFENMPVDLAARLGAQDIVAVNLDGIGFTRKPRAKGIRVRYVECYWPLGSILKFDPKTAKRNIELGYLDTYRAWHKVKGCAYAFTPAASRALLAGWGVRCRDLLDNAQKFHPALEPALEALAARGRPKTRDPQTQLLYLLEVAAQELELDPTRLWKDERELLGILTQRYLHRHSGYQFAPVLLGEGKIDPIAMGRALAFPRRLVTEAAVLAGADWLSQKDR